MRQREHHAHASRQSSHQGRLHPESLERIQQDQRRGSRHQLGRRMWQVENRTPFAADRAWVRDRNGAEVWLVAVKCTFNIETDGSTTMSREQPPVLQVPEYYGEPGKSSIKYEADLV